MSKIKKTAERLAIASAVLIFIISFLLLIAILEVVAREGVSRDDSEELD